MCDEEEVCCVLMDCSCQFWWKGQVAVLIADRLLKYAQPVSDLVRCFYDLIVCEI